MVNLDVWGAALKEAENPELRDTGLWAKSFAEADGDEAKARAAYVKAKVGPLQSSTPSAPPLKADRGWCPVCQEQVDMDALYCMSCQSNFAARGLSPTRYRSDAVNPGQPRSSSQPIYTSDYVQIVRTAKSRGTYIILGILFGMLGIHNFYAGRYMRGSLQLASTCLLGWFVVGLFITAFWVLIDLFNVTEDGEGIRLS